MTAVAPAKTWRVGSLVYDRRGLFTVFFWMLWGDFVLNLKDSGVAANIATIPFRGRGGISGRALVWHIGLMVLTPTLGYLMDRFGNPHGVPLVLRLLRVRDPDAVPGLFGLETAGR